MKYFTQKYIESCGCRSVGECTHNLFAEPTALADLTKDFSEAIRVKIRKKFRDGVSGWDDPNWSEDEILEQLKMHVEKGDMVDVAALAMFLWNRK